MVKDKVLIKNKTVFAKNKEELNIEVKKIPANI